MEGSKQPHEQYRDDLAKKLKEIRNSDQENSGVGKQRALGYLDAIKKTEEYQRFEDIHRKAAENERESRGMFPFETADEFFENIALNLEIGPDIHSADTEEQYYTGTYYSAEDRIKEINETLGSDDKEWRLPTLEEAKKITELIRGKYDTFKSIEKDTNSNPEDVDRARREWELTVYKVNEVLGRSGEYPLCWTSTGMGGGSGGKGWVAYMDLLTGHSMGMDSKLYDGQERGLGAMLVREKGSNSEEK